MYPSKAKHGEAVASPLRFLQAQSMDFQRVFVGCSRRTKNIAVDVTPKPLRLWRHAARPVGEQRGLLTQNDGPPPAMPATAPSATKVQTVETAIQWGLARQSRSCDTLPAPAPAHRGARCKTPTIVRR